LNFLSVNWIPLYVTTTCRTSDWVSMFRLQKQSML